MKDWSQYNTSLSYKNATIVGGKNLYKIQLKENEGEEVYINNNTNITKVLIQTNTNPMNEKIYDYKIVCDTNVNIQTGDLITFKENNETYLTVTKIRNNDINKIGKIKFCNYILKWKDEKDNILEIPCIVSNKTLYSDGIKIKEIPLGNTQISIQLQNNRDTYKLQRGFRLIIGRTVYKITNDTEIYTSNGLITLIATETQKENKDDLKKGIAYNTFENIIISIPETDEYTLEINGNEKIYYINYWYDYEAILYKNKIPIENQPIITYEIDKKDLFKIHQEGNIFKIKPINLKGKSEEFTLCAFCDKYNQNKKIKIGSWA